MAVGGAKTGGIELEKKPYPTKPIGLIFQKKIGFKKVFDQDFKIKNFTSNFLETSLSLIFQILKDFGMVKEDNQGGVSCSSFKLTVHITKQFSILVRLDPKATSTFYIPPLSPLHVLPPATLAHIWRFEILLIG